MADLFGDHECLTEPHASPFTYFPANVRVNGDLIPNVGVRKKGLLGSISSAKPSLKISFDEYVDGRRYAGLNRLTLDNNKQDPSHVRQCITYQRFAQAGLPAPRCNFARVSVNGRGMGIYTHVEINQMAALIEPELDASSATGFRREIAAGLAGDDPWPGHVQIQLAGVSAVDAPPVWRQGDAFVVILFVDAALFGANRVITIDGRDAFAWALLAKLQDDGSRQVAFMGMLWDGELSLDAAGTQRGSLVSGTVDADIVVFGGL